MGKLFVRIRQRLCRHEWRVTRFQALVPGTSYECTKCGKQERFYFRRPTDGGNNADA